MADDSSADCPFCRIAATYPVDANHPVPVNPDPEALLPNCFLVLNSDSCLAFLDIMPITAGHLLVIPRRHAEKLSQLATDEAAALGSWLPAVSRAVMRALGRDGGDWNVVQNNGAAAAQVVPHVHYHIIPRNPLVPEVRARSWTMFGRGQRDDLDEEAAAELAARIRQELSKDLEAMAVDDAAGARLLLGKVKL